MEKMACAGNASAQLVRMGRSLLNMGYDVVSCGKMVKIEARLSCEVRIESLVLMDQGNGEEQTRLINGLRRPCKAMK